MSITQQVLLALLFGSFLVSLQADVVFSDDFSDENRDGWYIYGDDAHNDLLVVDGALWLLDSDTADNNFTAVTRFPNADLSVVGAKVVLELEFKNTKNHRINRGIAIGLYSSEGTPISADMASGDAGEDDSGFFLYTRRMPFMQRMYEINDRGLSSIGGKTVAVRANDDANLNIRLDSNPKGHSVFGLADGTWHSFKLEIEAILGRDGLVDHLVTIKVDEGRPTESILYYQDGGALVTDFDEIGMTSIAGNEFIIDNVRVTYSR